MVWVGLCLTAPHAPGQAAAAPMVRPRAASPFTALRVLPSDVRLEGPLATQRLLATATRADGSVADVTASVRWIAAAPKVAALSGTRVAAQGNGRTVLVARLGGLSARVPVTVTSANADIHYSFQNDVVPVLARLGCSAGTCHGANSGKGGFKLSLRGYAPELDFLSITRQQGGRRISREAPDASLFLRKPLMEVPHAGGKALERGSREYYTLLGWLVEGAPGIDEKTPHVTGLQLLPGPRLYRVGEKQQLLARATYSDGTTRDVTDRALFKTNDPSMASVTEEGLVSAAAPGATAVMAKYADQLAAVNVTLPYAQKPNPAAFRKPANFVDQAVYARLRELNLEPSPPCTDEEFVRRAYLDVLGTLPTVEEVRRFLGNPEPDRRAKLIDEVLARPEYASIWALKLCDLFMIRREHLQRRNTVMLQQWFTEQFLQNRPWDQLVADLLTTNGAVSEKPQLLWWVSRQATRPNARGWVRSYELTGEAVAQVFLGQRIQCAKCHNHPTEKFTQDDYYHFAAIFAQVNGDGPADPVPTRILANDAGEVRQPRTGQLMVARPLDHADLQLTEGTDRRQRFAAWLTGAGREVFARNITNRIWARLLGQGIVDPVDDLRSTNPPRNEALLAGLSQELINQKWDLKQLMRTIMLSNTYQASAVPTKLNQVDSQFFSHYPVRRLQAEEMLDAVAQVTGVPDRYATYPVGTRAIELADPELNNLSLDTFGRPNRTTPCECDRGATPTLSQALELFNGESLQAKLKSPDGIVADLAKDGRPDAEVIEELFLRALARRPTSMEAAQVEKALRAAPNREEGLQDLLWALVNTKEFMFHR